MIVEAQLSLSLFQASGQGLCHGERDLGVRGLEECAECVCSFGNFYSQHVAAIGNTVTCVGSGNDLCPKKIVAWMLETIRTLTRILRMFSELWTSSLPIHFFGSKSPSDSGSGQMTSTKGEVTSQVETAVVPVIRIPIPCPSQASVDGRVC